MFNGDFLALLVEEEHDFRHKGWGGVKLGYFSRMKESNVPGGIQTYSVEGQIILLIGFKIKHDWETLMFWSMLNISLYSSLTSSSSALYCLTIHLSRPRINISLLVGVSSNKMLQLNISYTITDVIYLIDGNYQSCINY